MSEMGVDADVKTALLYRDRSWSEVSNPVQSRDDDTDWTTVLRRHGWARLQTLGAADGISVDLYDRRLDTEPCRYMWLAEYGTPNLCKTIVIERWQDLIDFMAHVSSTMLAAILPSDIAYVLEDLLDRTPYRVEEQKRYERDAAAMRRERDAAKKEVKP